ncbi:MAG: ATPase, T2SS/T4P/T4SS family [Pirellulales bacterium]
MSQRVVWYVLLIAACWGLADVAWAQSETWPDYPFPAPHTINRGPGGYLSWWKLLIVWLLMLFWVKTADWVNRDCQTLKLPYALWTPIVSLPFFLLMALSFLLPSFWISLPLLVLAATVPLGVYITQRNAVVDPHEKVLTAAHLRFLLATALGQVGIKMRAEAAAAHEAGAPVDFTPMGAATPQLDQVNLINARQSEAYVPTKDLIADAIDRRSEKVMLDYGRDSVAVRYQIDGVWHESDPQEREAGDEMLNVLKMMAALNPKERRERQAGDIGVKYKNAKLPMKIFSQGTKTGERVILQFTTQPVNFKSLSDLGMRGKMQEQLAKMLATPKGVFLFSSVPAGGLSTTVCNALKITDRYMRDFVSFQPTGIQEPVAENVEVITSEDSKGTVEEQLLSIFRREPNVVVVHQMTSSQMVETMCQQAAKDKLVLACIPAKEAVEALLRVLLLKVPPKVFAPVVFGVLNQRLIRKLCEECKEPYVPAPALLKKLGFPPGRVDTFYKPPDPNETEEVCSHCGGIGYYGRTALFELLEVGPELRDALTKEPKLETLRKIVRDAQLGGMQEEGLLLVAQGITSLNELTRVLKE